MKKNWLIRDFVSHLEQRDEWFPYSRGISKLVDEGDRDFLDLSELLLGWAKEFLGENAYEILAAGYVAFVTDVNRSQIKYEIAGHYANSNYDEVFKSVYSNEEFMRYYHWGVYVSTFAWPHHVKLAQHFRQNFIDKYCQADGLRVVDLGSGSGIWSFLSAFHNPSLDISALDISSTSTANATSMSVALGHSGAINFHEADALKWGGDELAGTFDLGISCFLMEHLEAPGLLLQNMARLLKPRGMAFVTLALTAAEVDHIYEFKRESEPVQLAEEAGFRVIEYQSVAPPLHNPKSRFLPRSMAMILSRREGNIW